VAGARSPESRLVSSWAASRLGPPGIALLLAASTFNGLTMDMTLVGRTVTIRPDQVVLLLLAPLVVATLLATRGRLERPLLHLPVAVLFMANLAASVLHSPLRAMSLQASC
jgi:hypothetical protein